MNELDAAVEDVETVVYGLLAAHPIPSDAAVAIALARRDVQDRLLNGGGGWYLNARRAGGLVEYIRRFAPELRCSLEVRTECTSITTTSSTDYPMWNREQATLHIWRA